MKICTKCKVEKPVSAFCKHKRRKDGLNGQCKACAAARQAAWQRAHPEKTAASCAAYHAANQEKEAARGAAYRAANREKIAAHMAAYRAANREKAVTRTAAYRAANPEAARVHKQNRRARKEAAGGQLPRDIIQRLRAKQSGLCACCFADLDETGYHLDHIVALSKGGSHTEGNMQLLTPKCNMSKGSKDWIEYLNSRPRVQAAAVGYRRAS